jgi:hypothetical protein
MEFVLQETAPDIDTKNAFQSSRTSEDIVLRFVLLVLLLQLHDLANYTDMCAYNYQLSAFQRVCRMLLKYTNSLKYSPVRETKHFSGFLQDISGFRSP